MGRQVEGPRSTFEVTDSDLAGRKGVLKVGGRTVPTPELLPVVNPNKLGSDGAVSPAELMEVFGFRMLITNSYIVKRNPDLLRRALEKGLRSMFSYEGAIMTDSGTFQSFVYGGGDGKEVDVDPLEIVELQGRIGSDVGTILDRFTPPGIDRKRAESALGETMERARASMGIRGAMELAVPVQGGEHLDLRERAGREVFELGAAYAPIGGVVPIMESYDYPLLVDVIVSSKKGLGPSIPTHLFGAGHPMVLPLAVALGCDLFDSASYAKYASDDRYLTPYRTMQLSEMEELPCPCPECSRRTVEDLRDLEEGVREGVLSRHNLWVIKGVLKEVRSAISEGTLWEVVERFALSNPMMYAATRRLTEHGPYLEESAPRSLRRFMCCSSLSLCRPEFRRISAALSAYPRDRYPVKVLALTDWTAARNRPVEEAMGRRCPESFWPVVLTPLGPAPYDVFAAYPMTQALFPPPGSLDEGLLSQMTASNARYLGMKDGVLFWSGKGGPGAELGHQVPDIMDSLSVSSMLRMQFGDFEGRYADELLFGPYEGPETLAGRLSFVRSRNNHRVRNVLLMDGDGPGVHILSIRADDGSINLKLASARKLISSSRPPRWRVVVDSETGEYNAMGKTVFNRFVLDVDPCVRPGDEVIVVDGSDRLLAIGRAVVSSRMMREAPAGTAVKVREGVRAPISGG